MAQPTAKPQTEVLLTVYSPTGEKFELSPANARDVKRHAGFTDTKPHPDDAAAAAAGANDENADDNSDDNSDENSDNDDNSNDDNSDENSDNDDNDDDAAPKAKSQPVDFADMDRDAVKTYIEATYPEATIDGRKNRDGLVAFAIELAAAAA